MITVRKKEKSIKLNMGLSDGSLIKQNYLTTSKEDYCQQPFESMNMMHNFKRKKNDISVYVDAHFREGVFLNDKKLDSRNCKNYQSLILI